MALHVQVRSISKEIQEKNSGRDEFLTEENELRKQLNARWFWARLWSYSKKANPSLMGSLK